EELESLIENQEKEAIAQKAHYIKNSCLNVALDDICQLLQKLESEKVSIEECVDLYKQINQKIKAII
ncbi:hypothetical protein CRV02_10635, partial [Arcobacter sp. CECT 8989]|uniref:Hpt domain-containing protein n=1 Tax=Arcobacter sp. CECT 8989 TaxID=2044509 RepID=UPI001024D47F